MTPERIKAIVASERITPEIKDAGARAGLTAYSDMRHWPSIAEAIYCAMRPQQERMVRAAVNETHEEDAKVADNLALGPIERAQWQTANEIAEQIRALKLL